MSRLLPLVVLLAGCPSKGDGLLSREKLLDPETCADCHPDHYAQWKGSMHAYAADDPVFRALEAQGQAETDGELGDFCVKCHTPLAVAEGEVATGADIDDLPDHLKGVTCAFCHQAVEVEGTHNNPVKLAVDKVMRGGIANPRDPGAHTPEYSSLHDRNELESADLCGSCHDIVTPLGAHIERTYAEWQTSIYPSGPAPLTCGGCHMRGEDGVAADVEGVPVRRIHRHDFPGVDLALTDFPRADEQRAMVQELLDSSIRAALCVGETGGNTAINVTLENVAAGHGFPSGASADRRVWVELEALVDGAEVWTKGHVADDQAVTDATAANPTMWAIHDTLLDLDGQPTHKFWEAADTENNQLIPPLPGESTFANHAKQSFLVVGQAADEVRMRVRIRPLPLDLLDELVADGSLDPAVRDALPSFTLGATELVWTPETATPSGDLSCVP